MNHDLKKQSRIGTVRVSGINLPQPERVPMRTGNGTPNVFGPEKEVHLQHTLLETPLARFQGSAPGVNLLLRAFMRIEERLDAVQRELRELRENKEHPPLLTVAEAAQVVRRSPYTVRKWLREGRLEGTKAGDGSKGRYLVRREDVDSLLREGRHYG